MPAERTIQSDPPFISGAVGSGPESPYPSNRLEWAHAIRFWTGKVAITGFAILATAYYFKYNQNDWTRKGGWRVIRSREAVVPGDPGYPNFPKRDSPSDYAARGFKQSPI